MFFIALTHAQEATTQAAQPANGFMSFVPFVLIFVVFYFLMIRPQKKKLEEEQSFLNSLKKGDEIYTKAGVFGTIYGMNDKVVTLEIAENVKVKVLKGHIAGSVASLFKKEVDKKKN